MKVACRTCGKKFKGTHGVAVHAFKMHRVNDISCAAAAEPKRVTLPARGVAHLVRDIYGSLDSLTEEVHKISVMAEELKELVGD